MKVSEQIIQVLDALCEKFGIVVDWTNTNIIPYLTELCSRICTYEIATSIVWMVIGVIMMIGSIIYFKYSWRKPIEWDEYEFTSQQFNAVCSVVLLVLLNLVGAIMLITQAFDIIQAICIPELTIIEHIKALMPSVSN